MSFFSRRRTRPPTNGGSVGEPTASRVGFESRRTPDASDRLTTLASTVYVVAEAKVLYVQVFKAACSTMLWSLAQMAGKGPEDLAFSTDLHVARELTIHDLSIHPVPTIDRVSPELRHEALTSPEWMRLGIVRDPYSRLYSGWESRRLLLHDGPWTDYPQPDLVVVDGQLDLGTSFRAFVESMMEHRWVWQGDYHFAQQIYQLALDHIDFTDIATTSDLPRVFRSLSERSGRLVDPGRHNEGLGIKAEDVFDDVTAQRCEELYDQDFLQIGFPKRSFATPPPMVLDQVATRALGMIKERNDRITDLSTAIRARN